MNSERKRIVTWVLAIFAVALCIGATIAWFLAGTHGRGHPLMQKAYWAFAGPLVFWNVAQSALWNLAGLSLFTVFWTLLIVGFMKKKLSFALGGAIPLAILWDLLVLVISIMSHLDWLNYLSPMRGRKHQKIDCDLKNYGCSKY